MSPPATGARELAAGRQLGKYRLEYLLGAGGMGAVWAAHDADLDRRVAVKVLSTALAADDVAQARLLREAQAMARLRHPNVITVYDATTIDGHNLVAMELIDGQTLAAWLAFAPRELDAKITALLAAGRGLAAAHAAGMIHRDFKPHNVLVETDGRVLVTDFGLARSTSETGRAEPVSSAPATVRDAPRSANEGAPASAPKTVDRRAPARPTPADAPSEDALEPPTFAEPATADAALAIGATLQVPAGSLVSDRPVLDVPLTQTGMVLGTPAYMAPEQFRGEAADARADQFAFCVTAWEALSGKRPFAGATYEELARTVESGRPVHTEQIPRRIRAILTRGLAPEPDARWSSMTVLLAELERAWRRPRRVRIGVGIAALGTSVLIATGLGIQAAGSGSGSSGGGASGSGGASSSTAPCPAGVAALSSVWSPAKRTELSGLAGTEAEGAVSLIDRWGSEWAAAWNANCGKRDDVDFSARKLCLEAQRNDLGIMLADVSVAARAVSRAELGRVLPSAESCQRSPRAIAPSLPAEPARSAEIIDVRIALHTLKTDVFLRNGLYEGFAKRADALTTRAVATAYPPVHAEALLIHGVARQVTSSRDAETAEAYTLLRDAANKAEAAGADRIRVEALLAQLEALIALSDRAAELDELVARTEVAVRRLGDPTPEIALETLRSQIAMSRGLWTEAGDRAERARVGWDARGASQTMARATLIEVEARIARHADGDLDRALVAITAALSHPVQSSLRQGLGGLRADIEWRRGNVEAARAALAAADMTTEILDKGGGDPAGGELRGTIANMPIGTIVDAPSETARSLRRGLPSVYVGSLAGRGSWSVPARLDGTWQLTAIPPGDYQVEVLVPNARGDTLRWSSRATITAKKTTIVSTDLSTPPAP